MCFPQALRSDHCVWCTCSTTVLYIQAPLEPSLWRTLFSSPSGTEVEGKWSPGEDEGMAGQAGRTKFLPLLSALLQMCYRKRVFILRRTREFLEQEPSSLRIPRKARQKAPGSMHRQSNTRKCAVFPFLLVRASLHWSFVTHWRVNN